MSGVPGRRPEALPVRVVLAGDDRAIMDGLEALLVGEGFAVLRAANGLRLVSSLQVDHADLVLLDVAMPGTDGFELCRSLKANPAFRAVPVICLLRGSGDEELRRGETCGADACFPRPPDPAALVAKVRELTTQAR